MSKTIRNKRIFSRRHFNLIPENIGFAQLVMCNLPILNYLPLHPNNIVFRVSSGDLGSFDSRHSGERTINIVAIRNNVLEMKSFYGVQRWLPSGYSAAFQCSTNNLIPLSLKEAELLLHKNSEWVMGAHNKNRDRIKKYILALKNGRFRTVRSKKPIDPRIRRCSV